MRLSGLRSGFRIRIASARTDQRFLPSVEVGHRCGACYDPKMTKQALGTTDLLDRVMKEVWSLAGHSSLPFPKAGGEWDIKNASEERFRLSLRFTFEPSRRLTVHRGGDELDVGWCW